MQSYYADVVFPPGVIRMEITPGALFPRLPISRLSSRRLSPTAFREVPLGTDCKCRDAARSCSSGALRALAPPNPTSKSGLHVLNQAPAVATCSLEHTIRSRKRPSNEEGTSSRERPQKQVAQTIYALSFRLCSLRALLSEKHQVSREVCGGARAHTRHFRECKRPTSAHDRFLSRPLSSVKGRDQPPNCLHHRTTAGPPTISQSPHRSPPHRLPGVRPRYIGPSCRPCRTRDNRASMKSTVRRRISWR